MLALRNKIPPLHQVLALYATIVFLIYGWATVAFLWKVVSWLYFLSLGQILAIFSYVLASSLIESTTLLLIFLLVSLVLPFRWFAGRFIVRGSLIFYILTFCVALFNLLTLIQLPTTSAFLEFGFLCCLATSLGIIITDRIPFFQQILIDLADRLLVFLYLWLPLSLVGVLVVLFRILLQAS